MMVQQAAMPVVKAAQPAPFSAEAIFCSSAATVGLAERVYEKPFSQYLAIDSWTKVAAWYTGVRMAPVTGSGRTPACTIPVFMPYSDSAGAAERKFLDIESEDMIAGITRGEREALSSI